MKKEEIIERLRPFCNGCNLPLSLNLELISELIEEPSSEKNLIQNAMDWALETGKIESEHKIQELIDMYESIGEDYQDDSDSWSGGFAATH